MKKAIIAIVVLLLLGGGGAGAYFYFGQKAEASAGPIDEIAKAEHDAKAKKAEQETASAEEFVPIDAIILPIIDETGVTQTVTLLVSVAAPNKDAALEVKRLSPRLKDAFIQDMYGALSRKSAIRDGVLQVAMIKDRLNRASVKVLGQDNVNDVLLQVVQQRDM